MIGSQCSPACALSSNRGRRASVSRRLAAALSLLLSIGPVALAAESRLQVTATTTMVSDLVRNIGGDQTEVTTLMGPGVDPHLYKASARDVAKLQGAEVIFYSGLMLEGKLEEVLDRLRRSGRQVHAVTAHLPKSDLLFPSGPQHHPDPHVWFDVPLWTKTVDGVVGVLGQARPRAQAYFQERGRAVSAQMQALDAWTRRRVDELPPARRILITSHDAFSYFGRRYGFKVVALQGISTVEEASLAAVTQLVDFVKQHQVKAVFVESSVPPAAIRRISMDAHVSVGGELFSDATGPAGKLENGFDVGTYEGMIRHNVATIVDSLK